MKVTSYIFLSTPTNSRLLLCLNFISMYIMVTISYLLYLRNNLSQETLINWGGGYMLLWCHYTVTIYFYYVLSSFISIFFLGHVICKVVILNVLVSIKFSSLVAIMIATNYFVLIVVSRPINSYIFLKTCVVYIHMVK